MGEECQRIVYLTLDHIERLQGRWHELLPDLARAGNRLIAPHLHAPGNRVELAPGLPQCVADGSGRVHD